ncbi:cathepsin L1-like isoform X2 [Sitophilus oryzae]|nr:cathepsin L1-like isoform X2 [Sitophilus oryzae]
MFDHNQKFLSGLVNYHIGINQFADMTKEEFVKNMLKVEMPRGRSKRRIKEHERFRRQIVDRIDWRDRGAVTPVKNQGNCGSCWSFSAIGSVEGQYFLKTGNLVSLSEQNLLDCATDQNRGCNGGWMTNAFDYLKGHTITSEDAYPYYAQQQQCQSPYAPYRISIQGYETISNEGSLQQAVATTGPISAAMDASNLQFYAGGVFRDDDCNSNSVNHGVLIVGYGSESGRDYWLVKNSWGPKWGEEGYFKIVRNRNNQCGIASYGMYPIL